MFATVTDCRIDMRGCTLTGAVILFAPGLPVGDEPELGDLIANCGHCGDGLVYAGDYLSGFAITCKGEAVEWRHIVENVVIHLCGEVAFSEAELSELIDLSAMAAR